MKTVLPSGWAFALLSLYLFVTAIAVGIVYEPALGTVAAWLISAIGPPGLSISAEPLRTVATATLVPVGIAPFVAYRYAVWRYDSYTVA